MVNNNLALYSRSLTNLRKNATRIREMREASRTDSNLLCTTPHVVVLFLAHAGITQAKVWDSLYHQCPGQIQFMVWSELVRTDSLPQSFPASLWYASKPTYWGSLSVVLLQIEMLNEAKSLFPDAAWYYFVSGDSVPCKPGDFWVSPPFVNSVVGADGVGWGPKSFQMYTGSPFMALKASDTDLLLDRMVKDLPFIKRKQRQEERDAEKVAIKCHRNTTNCNDVTSDIDIRCASFRRHVLFCMDFQADETWFSTILHRLGKLPIRSKGQLESIVAEQPETEALDCSMGHFSVHSAYLSGQVLVKLLKKARKHPFNMIARKVSESQDLSKILIPMLQ